MAGNVSLIKRALGVGNEGFQQILIRLLLPFVCPLYQIVPDTMPNMIHRFHVFNGTRRL
jgi:hypothetical protein